MSDVKVPDSSEQSKSLRQKLEGQISVNGDPLPTGPIADIKWAYERFRNDVEKQAQLSSEGMDNLRGVVMDIRDDPSTGPLFKAVMESLLERVNRHHEVTHDRWQQILVDDRKCRAGLGV